jgi:5-methylcytosine-specific restriction endonuclease McrA
MAASRQTAAAAGQSGEAHVPGWRLTQGNLTPDSTDADFWQCFNVLCSPRSRNQSSYKFVFARCLLENLYNTSGPPDAPVLGLVEIYSTFCLIAWNLVVQHGLRQGDRSHPASAVELILREIQYSHEVPPQVAFDQLPSPAQAEALRRVTAAAKRYVIGAVHKDTGGRLYAFSLRDESLRLGQQGLAFMRAHQAVLYRQVNYELVKWLEKVNDEAVCHALITKVEGVSERGSLQALAALLRPHSVACFYCGLPPTRARVEVDHFVPWSLVRDDRVWNLVLACRTCNNAKRDRLPAVEYLAALLDRNEQLRHTGGEVLCRHLATYDPATLSELYRYAGVNGYASDWAPHREGAVPTRPGPQPPSA